MNERFQTLRDLVDRALSLPPEGREPWLAAACADDPTLLDEARELVAGAVEDSFLEPAPILLRSSTHLLPSGTRVGAYRVLRVLGHGGMGVVYEAEQAAPRRRVALKLLADGVQSSASRERFRYEVEVLGTLDHPGIATIHDAGLDPAPWFAMELVADAETIIAHATHASLGTPARLELFLRVLDAVEHGHQRGVIHRDLKPDNVLVGSDGCVKVIDFGVARVADPDLLQATLRTQGNEMVGTLAYMSPEQAAGQDVDTRSDVYALGVLCFELLAGRLPIETSRSDVITSIRRIVEVSPRRLREAAPEAGPDLDAILCKALEKDPTRRYRSAGALADDVRRHLAGEAVEARPPGPFDQLRRLASRHRALAGALALVLVTLLVAATVSFGFAVRSRNAEQEAGAERDRFEHLYRSQFLQNVQAITRDAEEIADLYGGGPVAQRMIEGAIARIEALEADSESAPAFRLGLADAHRRLAASLGDLGRSPNDAEATRLGALTRATTLVDAVLVEHPRNADALRLRAGIRLGHVAVTRSAGRLEEARVEAESLLGDLAELAGADRERREAEHEVALIGYKQRRFDEALEHIERYVGSVSATPGQTADTSRLLANGYRLRAEIQRGRRRFDEARADLERCLELRDELVRAHPERITLRLEAGATVLALGLVSMALGKAEAATRWYERAHAELGALFTEAPQHLGVALDYARSLRGLGQIEISHAVDAHPRGSEERAAGLERAVALFERALKITTDAAEKRPDSDNAISLRKQLARMVEMTRR